MSNFCAGTLARNGGAQLLECSLDLDNPQASLIIASPGNASPHLKCSAAWLYSARASSTPSRQKSTSEMLDDASGQPGLPSILLRTPGCRTLQQQMQQASKHRTASSRDEIAPGMGTTSPTRIGSTVQPMSPQGNLTTPSDYYTHPAAADATLHLGAVPVALEKGPSRVPVALEGLCTDPGGAFGAIGRQGWASATVPAAAADLAVLTSNASWSCGGAATFTVSGLAAKLLPFQVSTFPKVNLSATI